MKTTLEVDYPFGFDGRGRTATTDYADHLRDMIEQFLMTEPGERVNRPDFGSGLRQLVFAPNSQELAAALQFTVRSGLQRWLDDVIEVRALDVTVDEAQLTVALSYLIRRTNESRDERFVRPV